ncbi:MAG: tetratricopeptide repeat protein [Alphaproteobacteria bacterium]|nr:tetratricopeptide repeat protein [Alphaproteobacteria bacterium]MBU2084049.1 tetratricopeptide repeat protein [Alphaproteobacteria bacterium]MBU2144416.1 tetratricopeptide repeat protein [Alphaproteobacteria bacterium]MBU2196326.1 tetratricopeptide repeat protein [Alphaproteobacteria bacterium]
MNLFRPLSALSAILLAGSCVSTPSEDDLRNALFSNGRPAEAQAYGDFLVARFAAMTNDPETAAEYYAAAIDTAPEKSGIAERAVFSALLAGDYDSGVELAKRASQVGSEATLVRLTLGVDAMVRGKENEAAPYLDETEYGPFNQVIARGLSAWRIADKDGADAAEAYLRNGLSGDANLDSATLYMMGLLQMADKHDAAALATFETLWESGARLAVGVHAHAQLLVAEGDEARALEILQTFRDDIGENAGLDALRADILAGNRIKPTRLSTREGAALAVYVPAAALMMQTDDDLSGVYFVLALALDPDLQVARSLWGQSLDNAGRRQEAIAVLSRIPKKSEFYATARGQMAWALRREERNQEALAVAADALASSPDRGLKIQLADLYRSLDRDNDAERLLSEIIAQDAEAGRQDWRIIYARGTTFEQTDRWKEAESDLKIALTLQPENASILNYLGYAYIDRGLNYDAALNMIRRAVELEPQSGYIIDSLGWAHYRMGRYELATRFLERAVELSPGVLLLNDHLGDAYWQMGRKTEARFQWQRALKLGPSPEDKARIEAKMTGGPMMPVLKKAESDTPAGPAVARQP